MSNLLIKKVKIEDTNQLYDVYDESADHGAVKSVNGKNPDGNGNVTVGMTDISGLNDAINAKYTKPAAGIPKTDLASSVQASLDKADSALQTYTETDPTVPQWAKAETKPSYTYEEISGTPTLATVATSGNYNDLSNTPVIPVVPTKTSDLQNDGDGTNPFLTQHQSLSAYRTASEQNTIDNGKVDKVTGKGLSANDYTNADKNKLAGIPSDANKNVQVDWEQTDTSSDSYIKNKPTIPTVPIISTDITTDATSDDKTVSPKAVKTYVDNNIPQAPAEVTIGATPSSGTKIFIDTAAHFGDYLYNEGNEYTDITGGWELLNTVGEDISFSKEIDHIKFVRTAGSSNDSKICIVTNKKIDLTNIDKLKFYASKSISPFRCEKIVYVSQVKSYTNKIKLVDTIDFSVPAIANVSNYTGEYYVMFEYIVWSYSGAVEGQLTLVELEFNADTPDETLKYLINGEYVAMDYVRRKDIEANKNVQADWNQANSSSGSYIKNKPTIPTVPIISTDITTDATSDDKTVSPKAVKTYVDNNIPQAPAEVTVGSTPAEGAKIFIDTAAHFGDYLYNEGNEYSDITGGWELLSVNRDDISFSKEIDHIKFVRTGASSYDSIIYIVTNKKIDLTNINKIKMYATTSISNYRSGINLYINSVKSTGNAIKLVESITFESPMIANTSNYSGEYYVIIEFGVYMTSVEGRLSTVELEFNANTPAETLKYLFNGTYKSLSLVRPSDLANIPVTDAGGYFEATTVEGVLQEIGSKLAELLTPSS